MNTGAGTPDGGAGTKTPVDVRFVGALSGCYTLASRRKTAGGHAQVFACRAISISATEALLVAPVRGAQGELLTARFDEIGILKGRVGRLLADGFAMSIATTEGERTKLVARIAWLKKRAMHAVADHRLHKRYLPHDPRSVILFADNRTLGCSILDLSRSGVAVSADIVPDIGTPIAVGTLVGHVVRGFESGFAVEFANVQDAEGLEDRLGIQPQRRNAVLSELRALAAGNAGQRE